MSSISQIAMTSDVTWDNLSSMSVCDTSISDKYSDYNGSFDSVFVDSHKTKCKRINQSDVQNIKIHHADSNSLCEDLRQITDFPDLCDVIFLVGPEEISVYGVRSLIGARSRYFFQLILAAQKNVDQTIKSTKTKLSLLKKVKCLIRGKKSNLYQNTSTCRSDILTIKITGCDPGNFRDIISYLHSGRLEISTDNVIDILRMAGQFRLLRLRDVCLNLISRTNISDSL